MLSDLECLLVGLSEGLGLPGDGCKSASIRYLEALPGEGHAEPSSGPKDLISTGHTALGCKCA